MELKGSKTEENLKRAFAGTFKAPNQSESSQEADKNKISEKISLEKEEKKC